MCGYTHYGPSTRCVARRSLCHERSNGARLAWPHRNGGKRSGMACSSTTTRTRRTVRPARHILSDRSQMLASRRRFTGTKFRAASRPTLLCSQFRNGSPRLAIRMKASTPPPVRSTNYSSLLHETRPRALAMRPGRRTFARRKTNRVGWRLRAPKPVSKPPRTKMPLIVVANSPSTAAALSGLERWRQKHPEVAKRLTADDVLVDSMRGRSSSWTRIRINLRHVPEELWPLNETPDPDDDPTREWRKMHASKKST